MNENIALLNGVQLGYKHRSNATVGEWKRLLWQLEPYRWPFWQDLKECITQHLDQPERGKIIDVLPLLVIDGPMIWRLSGQANNLWLYNGKAAPPQRTLYDITLAADPYEWTNVRSIRGGYGEGPTPIQTCMRPWLSYVDGLSLQFLDLPNRILSQFLRKGPLSEASDGFHFTRIDGVDRVLKLELRAPGWKLDFNIYIDEAKAARDDLKAAVALWKSENPSE